MKSYVKNR